MIKEDPIAIYRKINYSWQNLYKFWFYTHYFLGICAIIFSTLVAAEPLKVNDSSNLYRILAWLSALITGLLAFLSPEDRGKRYQRAWLLLTTVISKYDADMHTIPENVIAVHELGENIIHNVSGSRDAAPASTALAASLPRNRKSDEPAGGKLG